MASPETERPIVDHPPLWTSLVLWLALFVLYTANGRAIESGDVVPATLIPVAIARGDGPFLDRFGHLVRDEQGRWPGFAQESHGRGVSRYPIGPALVATPFVGLQLIVLDVIQPGWERDGRTARLVLSRMGKNAAAAITALTAVLMLHVLFGMGLRKAALPSVLIVALGTGDFSVASQGLWQHGPAELCLAAAWLMLLRGGRGRMIAAGASCAMLVACRPTDLVFAAAIALWVFAKFGRADRWTFFIPAALGAITLSIYHVVHFHTLTGGYAKIEQMHPWAHGVKGTWTTPFLEGAAGTLFSPSHGLLVYSSWLVPAFWLLPKTWKRLDRASPARWLIVALAPTLVMLSKYSCWWAGHCFGPRFWIDANPIFAVVLALALDWSLDGRRWMLPIFGITVATSIALQTVGFLAYPSTWHGTPTNVDRDHARLWDWWDNEVTRGLHEGVKARMW